MSALSSNFHYKAEINLPIFRVFNKRILFVRVPCAGGAYIHDHLLKVGSVILLQDQIASLRVPPQHLPYSEIVSLLGDDAWDFNFTVVRNPYARMECEFYNSLPEFIRERPCMWPDFTRWVVLQLNNACVDPFYQKNHFRPQSEMLGAGLNVYRLEDGLDILQDELTKILEVPFDDILPYELQSYHQFIHWGNDALSAVNRYYEDDFNVLGYNKRKTTYKEMVVS